MAKEQHFINTALLEALGGFKERVVTNDTQVRELVAGGAYLWGVDDREKGGGILNHVLLTSRVAYHLGRELIRTKAPGYEDLKLGCLVHGAILHDITKLYGEDREKLPNEIKEALGLEIGFREISDRVDEIGMSWLKALNYPPEVYQAIMGHDFPQAIVDSPYWKIILVADYMVGQEVMTVSARMTDVKTRWIDQRISQGLVPRIKPERFDLARRNIEAVAAEIFESLRISDEEFIHQHQLNSDVSQTRWEKFFRSSRAKGKEERAKRLVSALMGR